jgi:hypothetical protein
MLLKLFEENLDVLRYCGRFYSKVEMGMMQVDSHTAER